MKKIILWVLVIIIVLSFILTFLLPQNLTSTTIVPEPNPAPRNDLVNQKVTTATTTVIADQIVVSIPAKGATVSSPLTIKGKARGNWFFEASFPVHLVDSNTGLDIVSGMAKAEGNWMTDNFVPFTAILSFDKPPKLTGAMIILKKDNPSGLPENDASISIPVNVK